LVSACGYPLIVLQNKTHSERKEKRYYFCSVLITFNIALVGFYANVVTMIVDDMQQELLMLS